LHFKKIPNSVGATQNHHTMRALNIKQKISCIRRSHHRYHRYHTYSNRKICHLRL